jgi:hypothetical protein
MYVGDFAFDPLSLGKKPAALEKYKINELKNGRLAMLAFSGIVTVNALTGKGFPCKYASLRYNSLWYFM